MTFFPKFGDLSILGHQLWICLRCPPVNCLRFNLTLCLIAGLLLPDAALGQCSCSAVVVAAGLPQDSVTKTRSCCAAKKQKATQTCCDRSAADNQRQRHEDSSGKPCCCRELHRAIPLVQPASTLDIASASATLTVMPRDSSVYSTHHTQVVAAQDLDDSGSPPFCLRCCVWRL